MKVCAKEHKLYIIFFLMGNVFRKLKSIFKVPAFSRVLNAIFFFENYFYDELKIKYLLYEK